VAEPIAALGTMVGPHTKEGKAETFTLDKPETYYYVCMEEKPEIHLNSAFGQVRRGIINPPSPSYRSLLVYRP